MQSNAHKREPETGPYTAVARRPGPTGPKVWLSRSLILALCFGLFAVAAIVTAPPAPSVEGAGSHDGKEEINDIIGGHVYGPQIHCKEVRGKYDGGGVLTLNDAINRFSGQVQVTFVIPSVWQGDNANYIDPDPARTALPAGSPGAWTGTDNPCGKILMVAGQPSGVTQDGQRGPAAVGQATVEGQDPVSGVSAKCQWGAGSGGTYRRNETGIEVSLPAGKSKTPRPGDSGTCTLTPRAGDPTTTNTRVDNRGAISASASDLGVFCDFGPQGPPACYDTFAATATSDGEQPRIDSLTPNSGPPEGGTAVTVRGAGLDQGAELFFGGVSVKVHPCAGNGTGTSPCFSQASDTELTVFSPQAPAGQVNLSLQTPMGRSPQGPGGVFTYTGPAGGAATPPPPPPPPPAPPANSSPLGLNNTPPGATTGGPAGVKPIATQANQAPQQAAGQSPPAPSTGQFTPPLPAPPGGTGAAPTAVSSTVNAPVLSPSSSAGMTPEEEAQARAAPQATYHMVRYIPSGFGESFMLLPAGLLLLALFVLGLGVRRSGREGFGEGARPAAAYARV